MSVKINLPYFKIVDSDIPQELIEKVNSNSLWGKDKTPTERTKGYIDWNNANKFVEVALSKKGDIINQGGPTPRHRKKLILEKLIAYSFKAEVWLVIDSKTGIPEIKTMFYSQYT